MIGTMLTRVTVLFTAQTDTFDVSLNWVQQNNGFLLFPSSNMAERFDMRFNDLFKSGQDLIQHSISSSVLHYIILSRL